MCLCHPDKWPAFGRPAQTLVLQQFRGGEAVGEPVSFCEGDLDETYQASVLLLRTPGGPDRIEIRKESGALVCAHDRAA